jgi:hypothetical protein
LAAEGPKPPSGQRFQRHRVMASRLLVLAAVMLGCLIPQDYRFSDNPPPFKNNPVKITSPSPSATTITMSNGTGGTRACVEEFSVNATDPDLDDQLTVRWYGDYDPIVNPGILREQLLSNVGAAERGPATYRVDLNQAGSLFVTPKPHVLEVLVTDGFLDDMDRTPVNRSGDPDAGVNPSYLDRHVWIIDTVAGDCVQ